MFSGSNKQFSKVFRYSVWPECMTRPRYRCLFLTTIKQNNIFFAEFALRECLVRNTEVSTFVLGHQHRITVARRDKTLPRIQNTSSSVFGRVFGFWEVFLDSGKCFGFWEVFLDSGKCFWILRSVFGFWKMFLDSGTCFGFWEVFLDSGTCFWILGRVLDSGKCFGFWEVFLDSGKCFGFWEVFCPYKPR